MRGLSRFWSAATTKSRVKLMDAANPRSIRRLRDVPAGQRGRRGARAQAPGPAGRCRGRAVLCLPGGAARCKRVEGVTAPHAGGVVTIGYRPRSWLLAGLSYEFGCCGRRAPTSSAAARSTASPAIRESSGSCAPASTSAASISARVRPRLLQQVASYVHDDFRGQRFGTRGFAARVTPLIAVYLTPDLPRPALGRDLQLPPQRRVQSRVAAPSRSRRPSSATILCSA